MIFCITVIMAFLKNKCLPPTHGPYIVKLKLRSSLNLKAVESETLFHCPFFF